MGLGFRVMGLEFGGYGFRCEGLEFRSATRTHALFKITRSQL